MKRERKQSDMTISDTSLPASAGKAMDKYLPFLTDDAYLEKDARIKLDSIFSQALEAVSGCKDQEGFHRKIKNSTEPDPDRISPNKPISLLPGLLETAPFEVDIRRLLLETMSHGDSWERTKPALRFLELWHRHVTKKERAYIIQRLMETDEALAAHPLALYSEKIIRLFSDDPELIYTIFSFIEEHFQILPLFSALPRFSIPNRFRYNIEQWLPREEPLQTDTIIPVRHVNYYAGTCLWMSTAHYATLVDDGIDPDVYGDVTFLYVDDKLIGSMKIYRDRSIVGLRTVQDSLGRFPIVTGGVYVTTKEITIQAIQAFDEQGKWAVLYLPELPLLPMEFAWAEDGLRMTRSFVHELQSVRKAKEVRDQ
jgi:hypothetical protein